MTNSMFKRRPCIVIYLFVTTQKLEKPSKLVKSKFVTIKIMFVTTKSLKIPANDVHEQNVNKFVTTRI